MNIADQITAGEIVENLRMDDNPAKYTDTNGRKWRLTVEPDEFDGVDSDNYGMVAHADDRGRQGQRPAGFDGNAEKLHVGRSHDGYWWQPPADVKRGTEMFTKFRRTLMDILEFGYQCIVLESGTQTDAYGRMVVDAYTTIGMVEPFVDEEYGQEIVGDLVREILWDLANREGE